MKRWHALFVTLSGMLAWGCQPSTSTCPPATGTPQYLTAPPPTASPALPAAPVSMEIGGKTVAVDQVVTGPLCNGDWRGTVYVTCDVQVLPWEEQPTFLEDCDLSISPNTVVYVAYHNDTAYYNGCSCHTGETDEP